MAGADVVVFRYTHADGVVGWCGGICARSDYAFDRVHFARLGGVVIIIGLRTDRANFSGKHYRRKRLNRFANILRLDISYKYKLVS